LLQFAVTGSCFSLLKPQTVVLLRPFKINGAFAHSLERMELLQELLLVNRIGGRIDQGRLLRREGGGDSRQHEDRNCRHSEPNPRAKFRHLAPPDCVAAGLRPPRHFLLAGYQVATFSR
jgi:hypothetical protein